MLEREMFFENKGGEEDELTDEEKQIFVNVLTDGLTEEVLETDQVAQHCKYIRFTSNTKGRDRKRKFPVEMELFEYGGRWRMIFCGSIRNSIDDIATEVLGDNVSPKEATEVFLGKLRNL